MLVYRRQAETWVGHPSVSNWGGKTGRRRGERTNWILILLIMKLVGMMGATKKLSGQLSNNITKTKHFKVVLALVFGTLILQLLTFQGVSHLSKIYESWIGRQGEVTTTLLSVGSSRWPWIDCISFHPHHLSLCFICNQPHFSFNVPVYIFLKWTHIISYHI